MDQTSENRMDLILHEHFIIQITDSQDELGSSKN